ncbi:MAG: type I-E CRISPR-associated protein Cas7/Cse4/CasC, partial [Mycobacterium sp.]|nr:type I-E CRISPR-associated protein Cas7/Cse4/CasC [Mycobacterium sp.]
MSIIEIHAIHSFPPAALNRDQNGGPKTTRFGGTERARISSQALKRPARELLKTQIEQGDSNLSTGIRSRNVAGHIVAHYHIPGANEDAQRALVEAVLNKAGLLDGKELVLLSRWEIEQIAEAITNHPQAHNAISPDGKPDVKVCAAIAGDPKCPSKTPGTVLHGLATNRVEAADVAAFGRMLAGARHLDVQAAVQVAHAIGVSKLVADIDYFTVVEDLAEEAGVEQVGGIGERGFNTSVFYRYSAVDVRELTRNLTGASNHTDVDAEQQVQAAKLAAIVTECLIRAVPKAGATAHGHVTLPDSVLVTIADSQPTNLVGAFERPIGFEADNSDPTTVRATRRLLVYHDRLHGIYGTSPAGKLITVTEFDQTELPTGVET